jgi:hypothetical protein
MESSDESSSESSYDSSSESSSSEEEAVVPEHCVDLPTGEKVCEPMVQNKLAVIQNKNEKCTKLPDNRIVCEPLEQGGITEQVKEGFLLNDSSESDESSTDSSSSSDDELIHFTKTSRWRLRTS